MIVITKPLLSRQNFCLALNREETEQIIFKHHLTVGSIFRLKSLACWPNLSHENNPNINIELRYKNQSAKLEQIQRKFYSKVKSSFTATGPLIHMQSIYMYHFVSV